MHLGNGIGFVLAGGIAMACAAFAIATGTVASLPLAILAAVAAAGAITRRASARRVTWGRAMREGSPDARRLEALRRLANREGGRR